MSAETPCPVCGKTSIQRVESSQKISLNGDRLCSDCGTQWAPALPKWAAAIFAGFGGLLFLGFLITLIVAIGSRGEVHAHVGKIIMGMVFAGGVFLYSLRFLFGSAGQMKIVKQGSPDGAAESDHGRPTEPRVEQKATKTASGPKKPSYK